MEDAATAEISRAQVWQWLRHGARLDDGRRIDEALVRAIVAEETQSMRALLGEARWSAGPWDLARRTFEELSTAEELADFLTLPAYDRLITLGHNDAA
jgi:malate synthase